MSKRKQNLKKPQTMALENVNSIAPQLKRGKGDWARTGERLFTDHLQETSKPYQLHASNKKTEIIKGTLPYG